MNTRTTPLIVFVCLLFWGCENEAVITASAARLLYDPGSAVFLDVRTKTEYDDGHIEGSVHIPVSELPVSRLSISVCPGSEKPADRKAGL